MYFVIMYYTVGVKHSIPTSGVTTYLAIKVPQAVILLIDLVSLNTCGIFVIKDIILLVKCKFVLMIFSI